MDVPTRPATPSRKALATVIAITIFSAMAPVSCRKPGIDESRRALELAAQGKHAEALALVESARAGGDPDGRLARLRIGLLSSQGMTPRAAGAYVELTEAGVKQDPVLLEVILLSSYPPVMRPGPEACTDGPGDGLVPGMLAARAVERAIEEPEGALVPETRLADLVRFLGTTGQDRHVELLRSLVAQKQRQSLRHAALMALASAGTPRAAGALGDVARKYSISQLMQRQILDAMATNPAMGAHEAASLLESEHEPVRARAAGVLRHSTDPGADRLLGASTRIEALAALAGRGNADPGVIEKLRIFRDSLETPLDRSRFVGLMRETAGPALEPLVCEDALSGEPAVATGAIGLLARMGETSSAECLVKAAEDEDENVRRAALRALMDIPAVDQVPRLEARLATAIEGEDEIGACLVIGALGRAGTDAAMAVLDTQLQSDVPRIRRAAAVALYHLGRDDVLPLVEETFEDQAGPWPIYSFFEWRLLASSPDDRTLPLLRRVVQEGNPSLRDKVLEGLADSDHPEAIFLTESAALTRVPDASLEFRDPTDGKIAHLVRTVIERARRQGDADGARALVERLLGSRDGYLVALGLRNLGRADRQWASTRALSVIEDADDPWLKLEAVRALAVMWSPPPDPA